MVSELYTKLGLSEVFDGSVDAYRYMEKDEVIKAHIKEILEDLGHLQKGSGRRDTRLSLAYDASH
ncbi:MAG: hypothetical protein MZV64_16535 [Ignavibacteriales bacterium]|nr:hypothetical protein [Ignavibacteriales bacterium]